MNMMANSFEHFNASCSLNKTESGVLQKMTFRKLDIIIIMVYLILINVVTSCNLQVKCYAGIQNYKYFKKYLSLKNLSVIIVLTIFFISLPLLVFGTVAAFVYKKICIEIIKRNDYEYIDTLDGFDVFWSLEEENSKSIVNVAGKIEISSPEYFAKNLKEKLENLYFERNGNNKIFFRKAQKYGFYYWRLSKPHFEEHVSIIEVDDQETTLDELLSEHSEKSLPFNNEGVFQVLITSLPIKTDNEVNSREHGIIFRIHHSLGDGISLIYFLCENIIDGVQIPAPSLQHINTAKCDKTTLKNFIQMPIRFAEGILRKPDVNNIHGAELTGNKVFAWSNCDDLLELIKKIKISNTESSFVDILIMALARGLHVYFTKKNQKVPAKVSVILPIRFPKMDTKLANNFSVSIVNVPLGKKSDINEIIHKYNWLKDSSDALTNYYLLKFLGNLLPARILKVLLVSRHATLVLSNLPGPSTVSICGGTVKDLVFFVPNKGYTGLGITALTYGGVTRLAASADCAIIKTSQDLQIILNEMVQEIRSLHRLCCNN